MALIFPSLISADLLNLERTIRHLEPYCAGFHIDIMDNHFVPNLTWGTMFIDAIADATTLPLWIHLMVDNPLSWIATMQAPTNSLVSFHLESFIYSHPQSTTYPHSSAQAQPNEQSAAYSHSSAQAQPNEKSAAYSHSSAQAQPNEQSAAPSHPPLITSLNQNPIALNNYQVAESDDIQAAIFDAINLIQKKKWHTSIAINPPTPIEQLFPYLHALDQVLIMSVHPGKSGQSFLPTTDDKIKQLTNHCTQHSLSIPIGVDGGITHEHCIRLTGLGVHHFAVAAAIFHTTDPVQALQNLQKI